MVVNEKTNMPDSDFSVFVTFTCYKRRRFLDHDISKQIVIGVLGSQLAKQKGKCAGFVVMPDHVHAVVWFEEPDQLSLFTKQWKQRSSVKIKANLRRKQTGYAAEIDLKDPVWQPRYHKFIVHSESKMRQKLDYMHGNPVKAGLVGTAEEWKYSSAGYYLQGKSVGVAIEPIG